MANFIDKIHSKQLTPYLGFCFYWMWIAIVFYSDALVPHASDPENLIEAFWLWATWSHAVALALHAIIARIIPSISALRPLHLAGGFGTTAGCALVSLAPFTLANTLTPPSAIVIIGALAVGISSAWHVITWGEAYAKLEPSSTVLPSLVSIAVGLAGYFLVLLCPFGIRMATAYLLPIASLAAATMALNQFSTSPSLSEAEKEPLLAGQTDKRGKPNLKISPSGTKSRSRKSVAIAAYSNAGIIILIVCLFAFALCGEMLREFSLRLTDSGLNQTGTFYLVGGIAGLLALFTVAAYRERISKPPISLSAIRTVLLVMAAAFLVAPFAVPFSFAACYGLFGAGFWCFRAIAWILCFSVIEKTGLPPVRVVAIMDGTFALSVVASGQVNLWLTEAVLIGQAEVVTVSLIAVFLLMAISMFVLNGKQIQGILTSDTSDSPDNDEFDSTDAALNATSAHAAVDSIAEKTAKAAEKFNLSPRETEVAMLLAQGRSLPFVQDKLYISAGTAQTHARHIYKKMGVHSRQEFIDAIQNAETTTAAG